MDKKEENKNKTRFDLCDSFGALKLQTNALI